ncbi:DUF21-domain-containing protein, partial [Dipodascopsis tothii]|uniref:DUF21-domain-containing protein n=1 Tax=Dipodascopsis tothii TaxID=44089 RepID=UPI0034CF126A
DDESAVHHAAEYVAIFALVALSGISAGLTLGLMSLDETQLHVLSRGGTQQQRNYAQKIIPIRSNGHLLLTTLLLTNVIVNETLPIITEHVVGSGTQAVVTSTILIVIFSEIIPQAVCSKHSLAIGAFMAWPVRVLIWLLMGICWPLAKILDLILGPHSGFTYRSSELKELIQLHSSDAHHGGDLRPEAVTIMRGAVDMQSRIVRDAMTPISDVYMLNVNAVLDRPLLAQIIQMGHSRIPVYADTAPGGYYDPYVPAISQRRILGCVLTKNLLMVDTGTPVREVITQQLAVIQDDTALYELLPLFERSHTHMVIVVKAPVGGRPNENESDDGLLLQPVRRWTDEQLLRQLPVGVITFEDFMEQLLQRPILDEKD